MPTLTRQIIKDVVSEEVRLATGEIKGEFKNLELKFGNLELKVDSLDQKVDTVITQLTDIAGQFKKFDEEQVVLSGQMSDRTDRIEKLEVAAFGTAAA